MSQADDSLRGLACELADTARKVALSYFGQPLIMHRKEDESPVTRADREAEAAMRELLAAEVPEHGIVGEEYGDERTDAEFVWVLDPIDGTKAFITGKPLWGTLIGLLHRGQPSLGVIDLGALDQRWIGQRGRPTTLNDGPVTASACDELANTRLGCTSPQMFLGPERSAFDALADAVWFCSYGGDCAAYAALTTGHLDLVVEADLAPYDFLPLIPVIENAGGVITDWHGQPLRDQQKARVVAAANPKLHEQALAHIRQFI